MTTPVLVVDDEPMVRKSLALALERAGANVITAADGQEALTRFREQKSAVIFCDVKMPGMDGFALLRSVKRLDPSTPVVLITGFGDEVVARAEEAGAARVLHKPITSAELQQVMLQILGEAAVPEQTAIITSNPQMEAMLALARRVAKTDATVLIQGETGTGKEILSQFIHRESVRHAGPFVAVNCAALPESLIESELFGHERGSFTGAVGRRAGCFETASGGTLLLDEVTEIPLALQAKLLRALQEGEVVRVGSSDTGEGRRAGHRGDQPRAARRGGGGTVPCRISSTGSTWWRCVRPHSAIARATFRCLPGTSSRSTRACTGARPRGSAPTPWSA